MFRLFINDTELYLPVDFDSEIMRESPILNARGDYSYPFTVPYAPNAKVFSHIKEIESVEPNLPLTFELQWADEPILRGTVPEFSLSGDDIEITLIGGKTRLWLAIKNKTLNQLDLGSEDNSGLGSFENVVQHWTNSLESQYPETPYVFAPIYAPLFYGEQDEDAMMYASKIINNWNFDTNLIKQSGALGEMNIYCCHLYVRYVLHRIIRYAGYRITTDQTEGAGLDNLYLLSMNDIEQSLTIDFNQCVPRVDANEFLTTLEKMFGIYLFPNDFDATCQIVLLRNVLSSPAIIANHNQNVIKSPQNLTISPRKGYTLRFKTDGDEYEDSTATPEIYDEVYSISELPAASILYLNKTYRITRTGRLYTCREASPIYIWKLIGEFADLVYSPELEQEEIEINASPLPVIYYSAPFSVNRNEALYTGYADIEIPHTTSPGNRIGAVVNSGVEYEEFPVAFLFHRGKKTYTVSALPEPVVTPLTVDLIFPHSNYDTFDLDESDSGVPAPVYDPESPILPGEYEMPGTVHWLSLKFSGRYGLNSVFLQQKIYWQQYRRAYRHRLDITVQQAFALDLLRKYYLRDVSFIIDKISINLARNEVKSIRLDVYTASGGEAANLAKWILEDGTWDDQGVWMDDKTWKDN